MSEHRYDMVERQDPDNFTRFQTRERCALEIAAYVFNNVSDPSLQKISVPDTFPDSVSEVLALKAFVEPVRMT